MESKIKKKILNINNLKEVVEKERELGKKIVFCSGSYDVLHPGHEIFFEQCKEFGDILIVSVGRDSVVKKLKGPKRPINPEMNRIFLVASMQEVDYVILGEEEIRPGKIDFYSIIKKIKPDFYVLNDDDSAIKEKQRLCDEIGIELGLVSRTVPEYLRPTSSTEITENF